MINRLVSIAAEANTWTRVKSQYKPDFIPMTFSIWLKGTPP
jgi:hypothetical protein